MDSFKINLGMLLRRIKMKTYPAAIFFIGTSLLLSLNTSDKGVLNVAPYIGSVILLGIGCLLLI